MINMIPIIFPDVTGSLNNLCDKKSIIGKVMLITGYARESLTLFSILNHVTILDETIKK
jgi:hypothetical protein